MDFFNPFLDRGSRGSGPASARTQGSTTPASAMPRICRLIPACFRETGIPGVVPVDTDFPPMYFQGPCRGYVLDGERWSLWSARRGTVAPDPQPTCTVGEPLVFHVYDIVETTYTADRCSEVPFRFQTDIIPSGTVLKLLGRTTAGASICVNVFRQRSYFYTRAPPGVNITHVLQQSLQATFGRTPCSFTTELVKKKILRVYDTTEHAVYKIVLSSSPMMAALSDRLAACGCEVFESNVDASRRFVLDHGFSTFGWYACRDPEPRLQARDAWTELEYDCGWEDLELRPERHDWPPYRILSFDIECMGEQGFPKATRDEDMILQISCVFYTTDRDGPYTRILLSLGTCEPLEDTEIFEFPSEYDLLTAFFALLRDYDVDFLTGYNIANFDLPYIIDRATQVYNFDLKKYTKIKTGSTFEVHEPVVGRGGFLRSQSKVKISGVVPIDMYQVCRDKLSLSDYKLDTVSKTCLGKQKDDISYRDIPPLFRSGAAGRAKIGKYCVTDSVLVMDLLRMFQTHVEIAEIAKLAKIPARRVLTDGQQIRVFSCLLEVASQEGYILPVPQGDVPSGYQGATVINPIPGFYDDPVLVVDFASLYPSIMQAHNLCYSTFIPGDSLHLHPELTSQDYETFHLSGGPVHFVKRHKRESLLSTLLTKWLSKRKEIRKTLASCKDPTMKTILDKQQLAIKVTCNAVYGFTGVASGILPCLTIAETVTLQGRRMLEKSQVFVEAISPSHLACLLNRPVDTSTEARFKVIYGDTDSLFICCIGYDTETVASFADDLAAVTTKSLFNDPIRLEAEKIFQCLLLLTKKRYVGILTDEKVLMKGVDLIRKTACKFVQETSSQILELLLRDPTVKAAAKQTSCQSRDWVYREGLPEGIIKIISVLNNSHARLVAGDIPVEKLTFTTELGRPASEYKSQNLPHLAVYRKLQLRREELPQIHDRIPYVFIHAPGKLKSDLAEHPEHVKRHGLQVAVDLYFDKIVHGAANILQCLFGNDTTTTAAILYNFLDVPLQWPAAR
ncbi:DNA polymerase catalytic subunit [Colobine gammaherpesvirus 1]|uniref:DNA polymerase n=1 Tax=Colobine gammaherpesvirus 1 TaxID=2597325 RepID=A0A5B8FKC1_9GAMA|nr:DNA polymerase catalytic subunit [Colobine gammaherpesvirus 1]QDQ69216.1 DNA polymerase catalytic subunit [Colobine gammaherpesvirus 1]